MSDAPRTARQKLVEQVNAAKGVHAEHNEQVREGERAAQDWIRNRARELYANNTRHYTYGLGKTPEEDARAEYYAGVSKRLDAEHAQRFEDERQRVDTADNSASKLLEAALRSRASGKSRAFSGPVDANGDPVHPDVRARK